ncbi:MAG: carboxylating nicotinate-nucleotide diphosphorylase [Planctomycetaceae bacterium]|nr:carboxylating nicotinate-nucleotide diphosphorylase [Planctomycetaceae bacterium]
MAATGNIDWNALALPELFDRLARGDAQIAVTRALAEDLGGRGDITSQVSVDASAYGRATIQSRGDGVIAGLRVAEIIAERAGLSLEIHADDGTRVARGARVATLEGAWQTLLAHERTVLNFLTLLSGNATLSARFSDAVHGTRAAICDTRKTLPGLRTLQKYATRCGGAQLHRIGLFDAVLLKDNHLGAFAAGTLGPRVLEASRRARTLGSVAFIECEVDSLSQLDELLALPAGTLDWVLLDNMDPATLADAVRRRDARAPSVRLEASGGVRLDTVRAIADSGVDRISVGAITHSAPALDLGLDLDRVGAPRP